jgi:hypothetical protein
VAFTVSTNTWTISTTASTSQLAADVNRVRVLMVNISGNRVYLRFDSTAPTSSAYAWYVEAGERYEVPPEFVTAACSMLGVAASGTVQSTLAVQT